MPLPQPDISAQLRQAATLFIRASTNSPLLRISTALILLTLVGAPAIAADTPIPVGSRLELMVDDSLIDSLKGDARRVLHHPVMKEIAIDFDSPWEGSGSGYPTVFRDGDLYRMYYRGAQFTIADGALREGHPAVTCYAESRDGIVWEKPKLGLFEFKGSKENNIVWIGAESHNFVPFKDYRPGVSDEERYKAVGTAPRGQPGLTRFVSSNGRDWRSLPGSPVLTDGATDTQNLVFWDAARGEYRAYNRTWRNGHRDILTATSKDFLTWTSAQFLNYPGAPEEGLYTSQVKPYYRAPHLLIGLPTRYVERGWSESMKALPELDHRQMKADVKLRYGTALTDTVLMTSRDGQTFQRWNKTFLPPGPQRTGTWNYGHLYTAWGMIETAPQVKGMPNDLSIYALESGWTGTSAQLRRYTLRIDGFASVQAAMSGGELVTKPIEFAGKELVINFSTSAAGSIRIEIQDVAGKPIQGFALSDCPELFADTIERTVGWKNGTDVSSVSGKPVRLRFLLKDANLYSFRFR